jgi:hypothetical protein
LRCGLHVALDPPAIVVERADIELGIDIAAPREFEPDLERGLVIAALIGGLGSKIIRRRFILGPRRAARGT